MEGHKWQFSLEELPPSCSWGPRLGGARDGSRSRGLEPGCELQCPALSLPPSCPSQVHGSRLRLPQVTPADSGEYMCRVVSSSGTQEASVLVTIQQRLGPSHSECLGGHRKQWGAIRATPPSVAPTSCLPSRPPSPECGVPCPHRVLLGLPGQWTYPGPQLPSGQPSPPHHHLV